MKIANKLMCLIGMFAMLAFASNSVAQDCVSGDCGSGDCSGATCASGSCAGGIGNDGNCGPRPQAPCPEIGPSTDCIGAVGPLNKRYLGPKETLGLAARDHFSPAPVYAYGPTGLDATRMDYWNRNTMSPQYAWHGSYSNWKYGQPTALVVPPTAAFQSEYNWGVAQTRSMPIYHQFNGGVGAAGGPGAAGPGMFRQTPYWPSSTSQFGIYPVRGPW